MITIYWAEGKEHWHQYLGDWEAPVRTTLCGLPIPVFAPAYSLPLNRAANKPRCVECDAVFNSSKSSNSSVEGAQP